MSAVSFTPGAWPATDRTAADSRHVHQFWVDPGGGRLRIEQVEQLRLHERVLLQRNRTVLRHDHVGVAANRLQPVAEFFRVRHGRAQRHQSHVLGQVNDDFFPDGAAESVGQVVHLVHHHVAQIRQQIRIGVEHIPQHLGGHHNDAGGGVDVGVAGEQPHFGFAVQLGELVELLIGQCLHGCRVEHLASLGLHGQKERKFGDGGFSGAGGRGHQHTAPLGQ